MFPLNFNYDAQNTRSLREKKNQLTLSKDLKDKK